MVKASQVTSDVYEELAVTDLINSRIVRKDVVARAMRYDSRFQHWDKRASVRRTPRRSLDSQESGRIYFPPELLPIVSHPLVLERGDAAVREILVRRLYDYLHFTTELEEIAVIPVVSKISLGRTGLDLPAAMQADAFKIFTDEAWHAQFSFDLMRQVEDETGISSRRCAPVPAFIRRLDAIRRRLPSDLHGVEALLFAVVSETLISNILADLPNDDRLPTAVRESIRDHAEDEGRHHVYFRSLLRGLWPALTPQAQRAAGPYLPEIIYAFLEPDYAAAGHSLTAIGLTTDEAEQVIFESWPHSRVAADVAAASGAIVKYLGEVGALDDSRTADSFAAAQLV